MSDSFEIIPFRLECALDNDYSIRLVKHEYRSCDVSPQECIDRNRTYAVELWGTFAITASSGMPVFESTPRLLAEIPVPVNDEFIRASASGMKANRYVLVKQLAKSPGIYFSTQEKRGMTIEDCRITPMHGTAILFSRISTRNGAKRYVRLSNDLQNKNATLAEVWNSLQGDFCVGRAGKLQMQWASNRQIDCLNLEDGNLSWDELKTVEQLFDANRLDVTDDRSLATRRVLRYENDHLPRLLSRSASALEKALKDEWPVVKNSMGDLNTVTVEKSRQLFSQLIPQKPIQRVIDSFFSGNDLFQLLDAINPLAEFSQKRRLTLKGPGGYPDRAMLLEKRDVHWTDFGRICPIETPQGQDLGFSLYLAREAQVDDQGFLCAKYVINDQAINEVWLNVHDEISQKVIAGAGRLNSGVMQARTYEGIELTEVDTGVVSHLLPSSDSHLGFAASLIPFLQHNDGNRALMGANMMKQALPLLKSEPPLVQTGYEQTVIGNPDEGSRSGLSLGANLLVGYIPWDFYTYEDAVVISDSLVRDDKLTHVQTNEIYLDAVVAKWRNFKGENDKVIEQAVYEVITSDSEYLAKVFEAESPQGLEKLVRFSEFSADDILDLEGFVTSLQNDADECNATISNHIWNTLGRRSRSIIKDHNKDEFERKSELAGCLNSLIHDPAFYVPFFNSVTEIREEHQQLIAGVPLANEIIRINRAILEDTYPEFLAKSSGTVFDGVISDGADFGPGDLLVSRLRLISGDGTDSVEKFAVEFMKKYMKSNPLQVGLTEMMEDASLYAAPGISGRILKTEWVEGLKDRRRLKIIFETKHQVKIGDKLTGRHGNKGVISRIIPEHEMPYFYSEHTTCCNTPNCKIEAPHTHLEMLINPLTITSRMNLGQLYETSASWIPHKNSTPLIASPFSDDWPWPTIATNLKEADVPEKHSLYCLMDGKETAIGNEKCDKGATVGYQYILKLKHLAENKLKSRHQSALSPSTGQPITKALKDKSDIAAVWEHRQARTHSAQRLGEMEVWALQGHEAWHLLDELLFLKSDSEKLKQQMIDALHLSNRSRRKAFKEFEKMAVGTYKWTVQAAGNSLNVKIAEGHESWLRDAAEKLGIKVLHNDDGTYTLTHEPLAIFHRAHHALKSLVVYCRGIGLDLYGYDNKGKRVELVNRDVGFLPRLASVRIDVANDDERRKWRGARKITSSRGDNKHGLWPDEWSNPNNGNHALESTYDEQCDYIELPVPIDNPLFRATMTLLLSQKGCLMDGKFMGAFQELLKERVVAFVSYTDEEWDTFWQAALSQRSRLLMREEVVEWLKELAAPNPPEDDEVVSWFESHQIDFSFDFRRALPLRLTPVNRYSTLPISTTGLTSSSDDYKYKELAKASFSSRLHVRDLYRHFELMDFGVLKTRLEKLPDDEKREKRELNKLLKALIDSKFKPSDFFIKCLPVLPRNLRHERTSPRKTSSRSTISHFSFENDLNYLYQHILVSVEQIRMLSKAAGGSLLIPDIEERRLRPLVHALISNRDEVMTPVKRKSGRSLHGIIDILAGRSASKEGLFSRHLLGKRTDYSGRAVIIPDPELGVDETSLPYSMGVQIFRDILVRHCLEMPGLIPAADPDLEGDKSRQLPEVARIALAKRFVNDSSNQETIKELLRKAAEIHPVLLNRAPSLHRLSLLGFKARFHYSDDCIHLNPLVCSPFNADFDGDTMAVYVPFLPSSIVDARKMLPSKILRSPGHGKLRIDHKKDHALAAYVAKGASAQDIYDRYDTAYNMQELDVVTHADIEAARKNLKLCGISLGVQDFIVGPDIVADEVERARNGAPAEHKKEITDYWKNQAKVIATQLGSKLAPGSPIKFLLESGATKVDLQQLSAIRGIMMKPVDTETTIDNLVEWPILSSIVSGMTPLEYFVSCHGSRNGLADKGLLTAPAGDITNTMVQAAQGISVIEEDCGTFEGLSFEIKNPRKFIGRFVAIDITDETGNCLIGEGEEITDEGAEELLIRKIGKIILRSPVTCRSSGTLGNKGICQKCYGRERSGNTLPSVGYPAGIIAAQSIGETGTQLTLSSFHTGGAADTKEFGIMDVRKMIVMLDRDVRSQFKNGKESAAISQLKLFQEIYGKYDIADHHLEVIISTMFIGDKIRSVLDAAKSGDGFLSRLAFKDVSTQLAMAALLKERDDLHDIKSRVMVGQILEK